MTDKVKGSQETIRVLAKGIQEADPTGLDVVGTLIGV